MTRLHCRLNIFFLHVQIYIHTCVYICVWLIMWPMQYKLWEWAALSIYPIILFSGIVAVFTQQHSSQAFIGCCCLLCMKRNVSNKFSVFWRRVNNSVHGLFRMLFIISLCNSAVQYLKQIQIVWTLSPTRSNIFRFSWHIMIVNNFSFNSKSIGIPKIPLKCL